MIHWTHFCSVSLFTLTYNACSQSLWPVLYRTTDDLTLGGPAETVAADIDHIRDSQGATGLRTNASKCEIISRESIPLTAQCEGFISLRPDEAELLGHPSSGGRRWTSFWPIAALNSTLLSDVCHYWRPTTPSYC